MNYFKTLRLALRGKKLQPFYKYNQDCGVVEYIKRAATMQLKDQADKWVLPPGKKEEYIELIELCEWYDSECGFNMDTKKYKRMMKLLKDLLPTMWI